MARLHFFMTLLFCISISIPTSAKRFVTVRNQDDFDNLTKKLEEVMEEEDCDIYIVLFPGEYVFKEKHVQLNGIKAPEKSIHIIGHGATVLPQGKLYHNNDVYEGEFSVKSSWMCGLNDMDTWSHIRYADGIVEVLDANQKMCRLKSHDAFPQGTNVVNAYLLIPHWFSSSVYKIEKIEGKYVYFTAQDLAISYNKGYNVNDDYNYGKKRIRYKLCNVDTGEDNLKILNGRVLLPIGVSKVREGKGHTVMVASNCNIKSFEIRGVNFQGNSFANYTPLISISDMRCESVRIHHCTFNGMRSNVITIYNSQNVRIDHNTFRDCYYYGVQSDNKSANTTINNNEFLRMGKRVQSTFCVVCQGENYHVFDNKFTDFGYGGLGIGLWYGESQSAICTGIVEMNEFTYTDSFRAHIDNWGLMDSGAIYLWTKNNGTIIRNNYIHGFTGMLDNRGIFCDDGVGNIQIYGNVITGIENSYCIDSRSVASVETKAAGIDRSNVNIVIRDNVVDGQVRFMGREGDDNGCVYGVNYYLVTNEEEKPKLEVENVTVEGEEVVLEHRGEKQGCVVVSRHSYNKLRKSQEWEGIKKYIKKKPCTF